MTMGNSPNHDGSSSPRQAELEDRLRSLDQDIALQKRIIKDLEQNGQPSVAATTLLSAEKS